MRVNTPEADRLVAERMRATLRITTTEQEYRDKWTEVNRLTMAIYHANEGRIA